MLDFRAIGGSELRNRQPAGIPIRNESVRWRVGYHDVDAGLERGRLRRHPARPEYRHHTVSNALYGWSHHWIGQVRANRCGIANMDRCAVVKGVAGGYLYRADGVFGCQPTHRHNHRALKSSGANRGNSGL